ncbi:MAG: ATP-binding cassette domain-containing protein [Acidimicrobiales bacterium]
MLRRRVTPEEQADAPEFDGTGMLAVRDRLRGDLDVNDGEMVVLLGASGTGKTTWLRSLMGLGNPFDRAFYDGKSFTKERVAQTVGWVPEGDGVFLSDTVWNNVAAPLHVRPTSPERSADALDLVGLSDRAGEPVSNLNLGARRRVALARAVARRLPLLIVDGELDPTLWSFWPALREHMPWIRASLVATATANDTAWHADRVALIDDGCVVAQGTLASLVDSRDARVKSVLAWVTP